MKTIIFLNGLGCSISVGKSKFVWNDNFWEGYERTYQHSRIPTSDDFVEKELDRLTLLCARYHQPIVAGHSLGAWWAANLACRSWTNISKIVMFTPLGTTNSYPIFNCSDQYNPPFWKPNSRNVGLDKTLVMYGNQDLIVPSYNHALPLIVKFNASMYELHGGHFYQSNHDEGLKLMKQWIEL